MNPIEPAPLPPPRKRMPTWAKVTLLITVPLLVLCCGGGIFFATRTGSEIGAVTSAAKAYVDAVHAGQHSEAREHLRAADDSAANHDRFVQDWKSLNVHAYRMVGTTVRNFNLSVSATARVSVTHGNNFTTVVDLPLKKENGVWKICD